MFRIQFLIIYLNAIGILSNRSDSEENPQKLKNILENNPVSLNSKIKFPENDLEELNTFKDTLSRIIPFEIKAGANGQKIPTIRLAQILKKYVFPDWIWNGSGLTRKIGTSNSSGVTTGGVPPIGVHKFPTITFDNNYSRFLKLFTLVQFNNTVCNGRNGLSGICYHSKECASLRGTPTSPCAKGLGVCCIFSYSCGATIRENGTYFEDDGLAAYTPTGVRTCSIVIQKVNPLVKQIRLDFEIFSLEQPNAGNCDKDRFIVSGQDINNVIPILCGENNGTHIYVETTVSSSIQLSVMTRGSGFRKWRIRITQFDSTSSLPQPFCLQFESTVTGSISSFNYNAITTPQYLNNLNYAICLKKIQGFCSITFTNAGANGTYKSFQIVNANELGTLVIPSGQAGIGIRDCPYDYILINGIRLCGDRFNDGVKNEFLMIDSPVTDSSNGPFIVSVKTNALDVSRGFFLYYRQNPCIPS